jgi:hypothetical protein
MMTTNRLRYAAMLGAAGFWASAALSQVQLSDGAKVHPPYHGQIPAKSDVVFSTRFKRAEAPTLVKAFAATRVEWVYTTEGDFVSSLKTATPWFGGTLNATGPLPSDAGFARDFDDAIVVAPWMKGWGGQWVTTTHPDTQRVMAEQAQMYLRFGATSLQQDDPLLQMYAALFHAGDFNVATLAGFRSYLANDANPQQVEAAGLKGFTGDYRAFLREKHGVKDASDYKKRFRTLSSTPLWLAYIRHTVEEHYRRLRSQLAEGRERPASLSMNLTLLYEPSEANPYFFLAPFADYSMSETQIKDPITLRSQAATARALGMGFVPSIRPGTAQENRVAIATLYALGGQPVVPWDVYDGNDESGKAKRYFGTPEDYSDLYRFVRSKPELFDDLETAALVGIVVPVDRYRGDVTSALVRKLAQRQIPFAFVPVGGSANYRADPTRLRNFRLLITTSDLRAYSDEALRAMHDSNVRRADAASLAESVLDALTPLVVVPGGERLRVYPRARPMDSTRLVIHFVDEARGDKAGADSSCVRRVELRGQVLGSNRVATARWTSLNKQAAVPVARRGGNVYVTLPECTLWGVLELRSGASANPS